MILEWIAQHSLDQYLVAILGGNIISLYILVKVGKIIAKRTKTTVDDEVMAILDEARKMVRGGGNHKQPSAEKPKKKTMEIPNPLDH